MPSAWVKEVVVLDDLSLRLHAHRPVASLPDVLTRLHVLPPQYFGEVGEEKFGDAPVGAGPYRFVSRTQDGPLVMRANDEYWGGPKGRPSIRTLTFRTILDPAERFRKLLAGEVHIVRGLTFEQAALLDQSGVARVSAKLTPRLVFLQIDGDGRASKTPLTDRRVRRAISYALPIDDMLVSVLGKFAVRAPGGLTSLYFGYDPNLAPRPYDLQKARNLLSEAGYTEAFEIPVKFLAGGDSGCRTSEYPYCGESRKGWHQSETPPFRGYLRVLYTTATGQDGGTDAPGLGERSLVRC